MWPGIACVFAAGFAIVMGFGLVGVVAVIVLMGVLGKNARGSTPGGDTNCDGANELFSAHLEWIVFANTIVFDDVQVLQFPERGSHFLIGQNFSGKSSVFELIRRCLWYAKNKSFSNFFKGTDMSTVICGFRVDDDKHIISALFGIIPCVEKKGGHYVKVACEIVGGEIERFGVDTVSQRADGLQMFQCPSNLNESLTIHIKKISDYLEIIKDKDGKPCVKETIDAKVKSRVKETIKDIKKCLLTVPKSAKKSRGTETVCNNILQALESKVVHIFSSRAIGSLQWTESENMLKGDINYQNASDSAEILTWYEQSKENLKDTEIYREERYFNILTGGLKIEFHLDKTGNKGSQRLLVEQDGGTCDLLKLSEGILEAKLCSIILAVDCFTTILFEDPDRGMHPQMIQRLRDRILKHISNKTILITTHHPAFTAFWNIGRICLFRPDRMPTTNKQKPTKQSFSVNKVPKELTNNKSQSKFLSDWEYSTMFYASRILFVEGPSDQLFVSELKELLIEMIESESSEVLPELKTEADSEQVLRFFNGLEVIAGKGILSLKTFTGICDRIGIEWLQLEDNDQEKTLPPGKEAKRKGNKEKVSTARASCCSPHGKKARKQIPFDNTASHSETATRFTKQSQLDIGMGEAQKGAPKQVAKNTDGSQYTEVSDMGSKVTGDYDNEIAIDQLWIEDKSREQDRSKVSTVFATSSASHSENESELDFEMGEPLKSDPRPITKNTDVSQWTEGGDLENKDACDVNRKESSKSYEETERQSKIFTWGNGDLEDVIIKFANLHDPKQTSCLYCNNGRQKEAHSEMIKFAIALLGNHAGHLIKSKTKLWHCYNRSDVRAFLNAAINISSVEKNSGDKDDQQILKFVNFLIRCAKR